MRAVGIFPFRRRDRQSMLALHEGDSLSLMRVESARVFGEEELERLTKEQLLRLLKAAELSIVHNNPVTGFSCRQFRYRQRADVCKETFAETLYKSCAFTEDAAVVKSTFLDMSFPVLAWREFSDGKIDICFKVPAHRGIYSWSHMQPHDSTGSREITFPACVVIVRLCGKTLLPGLMAVKMMPVDRVSADAKCLCPWLLPNVFPDNGNVCMGDAHFTFSQGTALSIGEVCRLQTSAFFSSQFRDDLLPPSFFFPANLSQVLREHNIQVSGASWSDLSSSMFLYLSFLELLAQPDALSLLAELNFQGKESVQDFMRGIV